MKLKGIIINKKEFKWGSFLIIETLEFKVQCIIFSPTELGINDFIEVVGEVQTF
jgi:hypothetical protein